MAENEMVVVGNQLDPLLAVLEFTYQGEQGTAVNPVRFDRADRDLIAAAQEALRNGDVIGITADPNADLTDYKVERFEAKDGLPNRLSLRPKTPFGQG